MSDKWSMFSTFSALSSSSPRDRVLEVLQRIIDDPPLSSADGLQNLIQSILDDVESCRIGSRGRLTTGEVARALLAVKTMGKIPAGSRLISSPTNLLALLTFSKHFKDDPAASNEALKCVANALLLIEHARITWLQDVVDGGRACIEMLENSTSLDTTFVLCRILYLCTASPAATGSFIVDVVEGKFLGGPHPITEIIETRLDSLTKSILECSEMSREAMTDLLKFTFNLLVHYPKMIDHGTRSQDGFRSVNESAVMGDLWSSRLDPILPPLLRVFASLPPTSPRPIEAPLTHVIHNLVTIPVSPQLHPMWFGRAETSSGDSSVSSLPPANLPDILLDAFKLLDKCLNHYLPGDVEPDDTLVRDACTKDGEASLDDLLSPLALLITRLCIGDAICRRRMRDWLVPADLDRTRPLETRSDFLGRSLRLLGSVYHSRLKDAIGTMLFAMCDSDPVSLSSHVGYGNVAGFLFHKGLLSALGPSSTASSLRTPSGDVINPITGTVQGNNTELDMSDEEKEREAEKLFVLFERLEKSGVLPHDQNPVRRAAQSGRLQL